MKPTAALAGSLGLAALLGATQSGVYAEGSLDVQNPGSIVLGQTFTLEWAVSDDEHKSYDVELFLDSASCDGSSSLDLCNQADGCGDSQGDLNLVLPADAGEGERECCCSTAAYGNTRRALYILYSRGRMVQQARLLARLV